MTTSQSLANNSTNEDFHYYGTPIYGITHFWVARCHEIFQLFLQLCRFVLLLQYWACKTSDQLPILVTLTRHKCGCVCIARGGVIILLTFLFKRCLNFSLPLFHVLKSAQQFLRMVITTHLHNTVNPQTFLMLFYHSHCYFKLAWYLVRCEWLACFSKSRSASPCCCTSCILTILSLRAWQSSRVVSILVYEEERVEEGGKERERGEGNTLISKFVPESTYFLCISAWLDSSSCSFASSDWLSSYSVWFKTYNVESNLLNSLVR